MDSEDGGAGEASGDSIQHKEQPQQQQHQQQQQQQQDVEVEEVKDLQQHKQEPEQLQQHQQEQQHLPESDQGSPVDAQVKTETTKDDDEEEGNGDGDDNTKDDKSDEERREDVGNENLRAEVSGEENVGGDGGGDAAVVDSGETVTKEDRVEMEEGKETVTETVPAEGQGETTHGQSARQEQTQVTAIRHEDSAGSQGPAIRQEDSAGSQGPARHSQSEEEESQEGEPQIRQVSLESGSENGEAESGGDKDGGEDGSQGSQTRDADGTVEDIKAGAGHVQMLIPPDPDGLDIGKPSGPPDDLHLGNPLGPPDDLDMRNSPGPLDDPDLRSPAGSVNEPDHGRGQRSLEADLEDFFSTAPGGKSAPARGHFPALDNVNFETDEEVTEAERDTGIQEVEAGGSGVNVGGEDDEGEDDADKVIPEDLQKAESSESVREDEEIGQRQYTEAGARSRSDVARLDLLEDTCSEVLVETVAYMSGEGDGEDGRIALLNSPGSRKDYPLNYQNYKVCRELKPGVKECLILETGEQFICITKPKSAISGSSDYNARGENKRRSVFLVQQEGRGNRSGSFQGSENGQPLSRANVLSNSEAFAYISFEDGSGRSDADATGIHLEESQQAYITENGIPVILDNAEDDVKIGLQAEIGRLGMGMASIGGTAGPGRVVAKPSGKFVADHVVDDVLSSGGEREIWPRQTHPEETVRASKRSKKKRDKREKLIELQPEIAADSPDTATQSESDANINNNNDNNNNDEEEEGNINENANSSRYRDRETRDRDVYVRSSRYTTDRSYQADSSDYAHSYDRYSSPSRGHDFSGSRLYGHSVSRGDSYWDSRGQRSREDSSYYRSMEPSSVDSSRLSTRYSRIQRGEPRGSGSQPESVTVPKFKTLQDQQVSWLEMFKLIEEQHRTELQSQYREHQKILHQMQQKMEKELNKQQDSLKQRLSSHREILEELSPGRGGSRKLAEARNINQSRAQEEVEESSVASQRSGDHALSDHTSHTTLQGVSVSLRNPPPFSRYQQKSYDSRTSEELPVKRSLEKELSSPSRPADTSLNLSSRVTVGGDKQLRGGVYSSPMPLAKVKHKHSPRGSRSHEDTQHSSPREESSRNRNSSHSSHDRQAGQEDRRERQPGSADVSLTESDEVLSPRTRISLREKHAKHLADLRAYYEEELREMRQLLTSRQERESQGGQSAMSAGEKILVEENHELRQKYQELQDAYHDVKIELRELQQKIQGLEIRASDYAERYDTAQSQVLTLRSRLEELTQFAKDKETMAATLENKNKTQTEALQLAYKKEKELTDSLHSAKTTIQRLVDKYETLEKDHNIVKESMSETQEKLYSSRSEAMEVNNKLSRLELENKQLKHDKEILQHELTMARSALNVRTSYADAYQTSGSPDRGRTCYNTSQNSRTRSMERPYRSLSRERREVVKESSPETESDSDCLRSPIIRAERELKKLQESQEFAPKVQRKFYGTEVPSLSGGPPITSSHTNNRVSSSSNHVTKSFSPRDKRVRLTSQGRESTSRGSSSVMSPTSRTGSRGQSSRSNRENETISDVGRSNGRDYKNREHKVSPGKCGGMENGLSSDQAVDRVKSGEIVARPAWEDLYTSMAPARTSSTGGKGSPSNYTRDQMIRERLQNIENLERKYDDLTNEKRKFESALSKLPSHGQRGEKDRLEMELDRVDRELGSVRMSLKRFHVLKSTI